MAFASAANADEEKILGAGNISCDSYRYMRINEEDAIIINNWLFGFFNGADFISGKYAIHIDNSTILAIVDMYCEKHPSTSLYGAASVTYFIVQKNHYPTEKF